MALAFYTAPEARDPSVQSSKMGQALFESFDPRSATGIEIVEIDEENIESKTFEVSQTDKGWFIKRPGKTITQLMLIIRLKMFHPYCLICGLLIRQQKVPASMHLSVSLIPQKRIPVMQNRQMIALKNSSGSNLAQLIIGNEVEGLSNTRYVRKPEENAVHRVELQNVDDVTTKFVDWVEKDFLDLDKWNIKQVTFDNYEIKDGKIAPSVKQVLDYDNSEWKLSGALYLMRKNLIRKSSMT